MLTPAQVAQRANVTGQTIRNFSTQYGQFLSAAARGEAGPRLYDDEDVETLCTIAALRKSGVPSHEVMQRLRNHVAPPIVDVNPQYSLNDPSTSPKVPLNVTDAQGEALLLPAVISDLQTRLQALERDRVVQARQLTRRAVHMARIEGAIVALLAGAFLLYVLWLLQ